MDQEWEIGSELAFPLSGGSDADRPLRGAQLMVPSGRPRPTQAVASVGLASWVSTESSERPEGSKLLQFGDRTIAVVEEGDRTQMASQAAAAPAWSWEEIQRVIPLYAHKFSVRAFQQTGKGQSDAVRLGFQHARGALLPILDADLTMPPELLHRCYDAWCDGGHVSTDAHAEGHVEFKGRPSYADLPLISRLSLRRAERRRLRQARLR